jgi:hypothetical protein
MNKADYSLSLHDIFEEVQMTRGSSAEYLLGKRLESSIKSTVE